MPVASFHHRSHIDCPENREWDGNMTLQLMLGDILGIWEVITAARESCPTANSGTGSFGRLGTTCHKVFSWLVSTKIVHPQPLVPVMISTGSSSSPASHSTLQSSRTPYPSLANKYWCSPRMLASSFNLPVPAVLSSTSFVTSLPGKEQNK
jgi:hypothetical protein